MPNYNFYTDTDTDTDNESEESLYQTDDESDFDESIYEPEEESLTKYNLVLCEKYDKNIHGNIHGEINYHYLTYARFKVIDNNLLNTLNIYHNMNFSCIKVEIAHCIYLPSQHCISILKTFWLKIIQRKWKEIFNNRKLIISRRSNINSLKYRAMHGKWPNNCNYYPSLKGMLSNLSRSRTFS